MTPSKSAWDVAIKVFVERFGEQLEREARAISSLNHHPCGLTWLQLADTIT